MIGITLERDLLVLVSIRNIGMFPLLITCLDKMRDQARTGNGGERGNVAWGRGRTGN